MKKLFSMILAILMIASLAACGGQTAAPSSTPESGAAPAESTATPAAKKTFQLAHCNPELEEDGYHRFALEFSRKVAELSGGTLEVQVVGNSQLGEDAEYIDLMNMGTIDMAIVTGFNFGNYIPAFRVFDLPFMFDSDEEAFDVLLDEELMAPLYQQVSDELNFQVVGTGTCAFRYVIGNKKVTSLDECKGLKIRCGAALPIFNTWKAVGANTVSITSSEQFTAMQQGAMDCCELPILTQYSLGFQDIAEYLSMIPMTHQYLTIGISNSVWDTLTPEEQAIMNEAGAYAGDFQRNWYADIEAARIEDMKAKGVEALTEYDAESFAAVASEVHESFRAEIGSDLLDKVQSMTGFKK